MLSTRVNGKMARDKEEEFNTGLMAQFIKAIGSKIWLMEKVDLFILMVIFTVVTGLETALKEWVFLFMLMEIDIKVNGFRINNTELVLKSNKISLIKVVSRTVLSMARAESFGRMIQLLMKAISLKV